MLDAKRGDIASTAEAYARAAFETLGADAVTLNPYLGRDSLAPFLADAQRGVFLLCKTSNPGAADLQDLAADRRGQTVWEQVAGAGRGVERRATTSGLVVGATYPTRCAACARSRPTCGSWRPASARRAASWRQPGRGPAQRWPGPADPGQPGHLPRR